MQNIDRNKMLPNQVTVLFAGSALLFNLPTGATFVDLADRLDDFSENHDGMPTAVYLKFSADRRQASVEQPGILICPGHEDKALR